ncbi:transthyretin-like family domain-containing protein [Ditylenchus destructor]|nr:transthyretin-like family domain-containing protein [Ditylenchus destructor]
MSYITAIICCVVFANLSWAWQYKVVLNGQVQCSDKSVNLDNTVIWLWEEFYNVWGRDDKNLASEKVLSADGKFHIEGWTHDNDQKIYLKIKHQCCPGRDCNGWINYSGDWSTCDKTHCPLEMGTVALESLN